MMLFLPIDTWLRLVIWLALGLVIYLAYGMHHSTLRGSPGNAFPESERADVSDHFRVTGILLTL